MKTEDRFQLTHNNGYRVNNFGMTRKSEGGFTFIEVIVAIAIVAILSVLMATALGPNNQIAKASDGKRKSDINKISIALEDYLNDHPCYPTAEEMECNPGTGLDPYLKTIPCDPKTKQSYLYVRPEDDCKKYVIYAQLERSETCTGYQHIVSSPNYLVSTSCIVPTSAPVVPTVTTTPSGLFACFSGVCLPDNEGACVPNYDNADICSMFCPQVDLHGNYINECQRE